MGFFSSLFNQSPQLNTSSAYEEFMIILTTAGLIIAILNYTHKK